MKHSEDIKMEIGGKFINDKYKYVHQLVDDLNKLCKQVRKEQYAINGVSNRFDSKYTPPFRVGRKQGKAVLDATGIEVVFFSNSEEQARMYCDYLNGC